MTGWMTRAPTNSHDVDGVPASAREPTVFVIDKGNATAHEYMNEWRLPSEWIPSCCTVQGLIEPSRNS